MLTNLVGNPLCMRHVMRIPQHLCLLDHSSWFRGIEQQICAWQLKVVLLILFVWALRPIGRLEAEGRFIVYL